MSVSTRPAGGWSRRPARATANDAASAASTLRAMSIGPQNVITDDVAERLKAATDLLESVVRDRSVLGALRWRNEPGSSRQPGTSTTRHRAAAPVGQDDPPAGEGGEAAAGRGGARRDRDPRAAREAGVHDAERVPARRRSTRWSWTTTPSSARWSSRSTATSASSATARSTTSTTSSARRAATSTSPSARRPPTSAGRVALLTGGRVKIGYQAGIKLLRAGAQLIVTTRFPRDAAVRYAREPDFDDWGDRLEVFGLDLRHTPSVEAFCTHLLDDARPARLHRQQRLPDGAPAARVLPPHARARDGARDDAGRARLLGEYEVRVRRVGRPGVRARASAHAPPSCRSSAAADDDRRAERPLPRGPPRPGPAAGRPARAATRGG